MKALVYVEAKRLVIRDIDTPVPDEGEVLVQVMAAGICGSDLHGFVGRSAIRFPEMVFGHEFTGIVAGVGDGVSDSCIGERVVVMPLLFCGACGYCQEGHVNMCVNRRLIGAGLGEVVQGGFAEYVSVPRRNTLKLPKDVDYVAGAWTEPLATPVHAMHEIQAVRHLGGSILILGAGCQGNLFVQLARAQGYADIIALDVNEDRLNSARLMGATVAATGIDKSLRNRITELTSGRGVDLVVDTVGKRELRAQASEILRRRGVIVLVGLSEPELELDAGRFVNSELTMRGSWCYTMSDFALSLDLLQRGVVETAPVTKTATLEEGQKIFERLASGTAGPEVKHVFVMV